MNAPIWVAWAVVAVLAIISVILLAGRGSFLIAGYNTLSKENKQKFNAKRLCRVVGSATAILSIIFGIATFYRFEMPTAISWIIPWGMFGIIIIMEILACTICRKKPPSAEK